MAVLRQPRVAMPMAAQRAIHARGYNNFDDVVSMTFNDINSALNCARGTDEIVYIFKRHGEEVMTPEQIMYGFGQVCHKHGEKTPEFWDTVVPLVKKQMTTLDAQTIRPLHMAI